MGAAGRLGCGPEHAAEAGWRARIVLMWADASSLASIVRTLGKTKKTAYRWRVRYLEQCVDGLARDDPAWP
ncbi:helix-turn-helix domain-containing protein [Rhizobium johnstonii]|uniref:helix-turn-helix domain-containing protein n=1 Tax=Rhizobium johnstonii TaxID=3019933 RepID=UPI003F9788AE